MLLVLKKVMNWKEIKIKNKEGVVVINRIHKHTYGANSDSKVCCSQDTAKLSKNYFLSSVDWTKNDSEVVA